MFYLILVLMLSPNVVLCKIVVTPDLLVPIKQLNEACGYDACPVPLADVINVHIVPHTHYELALQRTFAEHYTGYVTFDNPILSQVNMKRTLDGVITELWANHFRRFTLSDMPYFFHWWSQRDENVRQMVYTLIRQGRLSFVGGGWSMNDEATTNYHAIIDSFTYSLRKINATFWECGRPLVAWQADVYGHSKEFASLAAQMGYDALFISPISFDDELARMGRWALEMLWRGSDDLGPASDIFTHKLFDGYWPPPGFCFSSLCPDPLLVISDSVFSNVEERAQAFIDSIHNRQAPNYNSSHVMVMMGMMLGYHDSPYWFSNIEALMSAVHDKSVKGKKRLNMMYSTPACYAKAVHDSEVPLETKQDDFFPMSYDKYSYLTGFYTTSPSIKIMARNIMVYLQMCKQLRVFADIGPRHNSLFEELNWVMGAFQDHNIITGIMKDYVRSYYAQKMYNAMQRSTILLKDAWNKLRNCPNITVYYRCSLNISRCHHIIGENYFLQIQNVLAWAVTIPVRFPIQYFGEEIRVYNPKGNLVKSTLIKIPAPVLNIHSRVNKSNYEVVFIAKDLPPLGFRSYFVQRVTATNRYKRDATENMGNDASNSNDKDSQKEHKNDNRPVKNAKEGIQISHAADNWQRYANYINNREEYIKEDKDVATVEDPDEKFRNENSRMKNKIKNNISDKDRIHRRYKKEETRSENSTDDEQLRNKRGSFQSMDEINDDDKRDVRQRTPLIKNIKPSKKYLIRQTNPQVDEVLYDMVENDYDTAQNNSTADKEKVNVLLENDVDDNPMQQSSGDNALDIQEDIVGTPVEGQNTTVHDQQLTTSKDQQEQLSTLKEQQLASVKEQQAPIRQLQSKTIKEKTFNNKDKYTTTILRNPVVTSDELLEQLEKPSQNNETENISSDKVTTQNWYKVTENGLKFTNNSIKPHRRFENILKEMYHPITPRLWSAVGFDLEESDAHKQNETKSKGIDMTEEEVTQKYSEEYSKGIDMTEEVVTQRYSEEVTSKRINTITRQHWHKVPSKNKMNTVNDTIKPLDWNKVRYKDSNGRVNIITDPKNNVAPNKTPSPKITVTPTFYTLPYDGLRENVINFDREPVVNEKVKKVEEERLVEADEKYYNKPKASPEPTENEVIVDRMLEQESQRPGYDFVTSEQTIVDVANAKIDTSRKQFAENSGTMQEQKSQSDEGVGAVVVDEDTLDLRTVNNTYIENKYIRIIIDPATSKVTSVTLSNGVQVNLDIQFFYYYSDDPDALKKMNVHSPGAAVFRAMENTPTPVLDFLDVQVFKSDVVEEAHFIYSTWTSFVIRLYEDSPVIEVEWLIGSIPIDDKLGKEVFVRYLTNLVHEGVFYTDSNGRQTIKRIRHIRPTYESMNPDPVAGNFYPVTSKISIEDLNANVRFTVFVDRAQGGTSLADGEVDLMLNRRILTDDSGRQTFANDTEYGQGVVVRGKHQLYISKANYKPYKIFEKKFAKEVYLTPQILVSRPDPYLNYSKQIWYDSINELSFLKKKLPIGVHLLTLEEWNADTILLRLENYLEKSDTLKGNSKTVYIQEMFTNIYITSVKETTLGANMWMEERQRNKPIWPKKESFVRSFNDFFGVDKEVEFLKDETQVWEPVDFIKGIKLAPQQIRTFVCNFDYIEM